jgi:hypothetical protein
VWLFAVMTMRKKTCSLSDSPLKTVASLPEQRKIHSVLERCGWLPKFWNSARNDQRSICKGIYALGKSSTYCRAEGVGDGTEPEFYWKSVRVLPKQETQLCAFVFLIGCNSLPWKSRNLDWGIWWCPSEGVKRARCHQSSEWVPLLSQCVSCH